MTECSASIHTFIASIKGTSTAVNFGCVTRIMPTYIEADGPSAPLGALCRIGKDLIAEVVKTEIGRVTLVPYASINAICIGDRVETTLSSATVATGPGVLGRVIDPLGRPLDGDAPIQNSFIDWPITGVLSPALDRISPTQSLSTGFRSLDTLLTLGIGQRVGIFAGSGVGKTTLLSGIARHVEADVCVLCLVGERGREAQDFWSKALSEKARRRAVMVVATSDQPAVMRARSVLVALSHAEYFRSIGKHVLLLIDSVTRFALAMREIGLAAGEPPTVRAYTPGVFAALPKIVERCGALHNGGAITSIMTVLTETDDVDDPMAETLRALLDGHIVLTRTLAEQGHFPAIDIPRSVSRVFRQVVTAEDRKLAMDAISQLSLYESSRTLVESGLYAAGSNPSLDRALLLRPKLIDYLRQDAETPMDRAEAMYELAAILQAA